MIQNFSGSLPTLNAAWKDSLLSCRAGTWGGFKTVATNAAIAATVRKRKMTETKRKMSSGRRTLFRRDSTSMSASRWAVILEKCVCFSEIAQPDFTTKRSKQRVRSSSTGKALYALCRDHVGLFIAQSNDHTLSDTLEKGGSHGFPSRPLTPPLPPPPSKRLPCTWCEKNSTRRLSATLALLLRKRANGKRNGENKKNKKLLSVLATFRSTRSRLAFHLPNEELTAANRCSEPPRSGERDA